MLAKQLVSEQVEIVRRQSIVEGIKKKLFETKADIIMSRVRRRFLYRYDGKRFIVACLDTSMMENGLSAFMTLAYEPESFVKGKKLTKREAEMIKEYEELFKECRREYSMTLNYQLTGLAHRLALLKNRIKLVEIFHQYIDFSDANDPDFCNTSGIVYGCDRFDKDLMI